VSYLSRTLTGYDSVAFLNRTYGSTARVWAPATRDYLYPAFDFMVAQDYWLGRQRSLSDVFFSQEPPEVIHRALLDLTISHLLIDMPTIQARAETARLPTSTLFSAAFLENPRWTQIEYASKGIRVYRLTTPGRPARTRSQGQNLIGDAGFEQFPATGSPWKPVGDPVPLRGEQWAATGAGAVLVDGVNHVIQALPTHEGTLYRLSLRARTEQGQGRGRFEIRWLDGNGKQLRYGWVPFAVGPDYQEQIFYETAPAGARQAVILGSGLRPTDRIVLDDVRLVVIPGG
jgi:hypothetical protein